MANRSFRKILVIVARQAENLGAILFDRHGKVGLFDIGEKERARRKSPRCRASV